jgi:hypothetical protein
MSGAGIRVTVLTAKVCCCYQFCWCDFAAISFAGVILLFLVLTDVLLRSVSAGVFFVVVGAVCCTARLPLFLVFVAFSGSSFLVLVGSGSCGS